MRSRWAIVLTAGLLTGSSISVCAESEVQTTDQAIETSDYVFGSLDLSFADYYYGEVKEIEPESPAAEKGQYEVTDPVEAAGMNAAGQYDAVTSATNAKSTMFEQTYTEANGDGANILGVSGVHVAISKALYEDVQAAIENGTACSNQLLTLVSALGEVSDTVPDEYKVILSDGTLSKTIGNTVVADGAEAEITTTSPWGNYQIDITGLDDLDSATIQGALLVTDDGAVYGLEHLDNLWLSPSEIAFSVAEFTDPHENVAGYQRFEDIQGKTIEKIIYRIADADDIEVDTALYCKQQLPEGSQVTADESVAYNKAGMEIAVSFDVPEDANYTISSATKSRNAVDTSACTLADGILNLDSSIKPGNYTLIFSDEQYANLTSTCLIESGLADTDLTFHDQQLALADNEQGLTLSDYLNAITSVTVNEIPVSGNGLGSILFAEDGSIQMDAVVTNRGEETVVFEGSDSYDVVLQADGYPEISFTVAAE